MFEDHDELSRFTPRFSFVAAEAFRNDEPVRFNHADEFVRIPNAHGNIENGFSHLRALRIVAAIGQLGKYGQRIVPVMGGVLG